MKRPLKPCHNPKCRELTRERYCEKHKAAYEEKQKQIQKDYDKQRGSSTERGYDYRWQKASRSFLKRNPLCVCEECKKKIVPLPANVVDHITPHKGNMKLFWDKNNWQSMNKRCHDKKTAKEDGGFGRDSKR
ncbi:HNH endonuclease signature motif containing protein [Evansella cellulosilytica]|uniref:Putative HNH nuclease YajD n=1 Tax=Evansella cellulosilytica (strain ATCC 21833 / DSM 2522 / FERM P-1141 / JCM 9156 / N-4) TaxID=649639 RepID=E6TVH4_EVAC2|nr:HNH endonuclease signature motif containing protein [Evansella cellulosilytica]ADU30991.1 HNH endonuclease [Evansella cellulosilytica DSM 2522]